MSTTPPQMDVLYMQTFLQVLGIFTRKAEPGQIEATAGAFVTNGFRLSMPVYTTMQISRTGGAGGMATLNVQVVAGDPPQVGANVVVQGTTQDSGAFNGATQLTGVTLSASGSGTVTYDSTANAATAPDSGWLIAQTPKIIDFVIPASLIGLLRTNFSLSALTQPTGCCVTPSTGTPTGVTLFPASPSSNTVIVAVNPLTITPPSTATGTIMILYQDVTTGATTPSEPISIPSPVTPVPVPLGSLDPAKTYRAIVFVPGSPIAVSGSFQG